MDDLTRINHYVPQWYQKRFFPLSAKETRLACLDKFLKRVPKANGGFYTTRGCQRIGPSALFREKDLYTFHFGHGASDAIEKHFFGKIDAAGARAVRFFHDYDFRTGAGDALDGLVAYLDAQKMRTPKGLDLIKSFASTKRHESALVIMRRLHQMYTTVWLEGVWEVVRCENSPTKFITSDHPVTTYNKALFPKAPQSQYPNDALITALGTHTIFPMGLDRCLIITNLGYVRDPWANPLGERINARSFGQTIFNLLAVQRGREIKEDWVLAINYIIKQRAKQYVAAYEEEWLYPDKRLSKCHWNKLGGQFFLHPDPRLVSFTAETLAQFATGEVFGADEYGRSPSTRTPDALRDREWKSFHKWRKVWDLEFGRLDSAFLSEWEIC